MITTHSYRAELDGKKIIVRDDGGDVVENVEYAGTTDNRTLYAYIRGVGFIGGWQWPHPPWPWKTLAWSINQGKLYGSSEELPTLGGKGSRGPRNI